MWKYILVSIFLLVVAIIAIVRVTTSQRYNIYKKYKRMINFYKERFSNDISNELVYQYISDIDGLPKINNNTEYMNTFIEFYNLIYGDNKISDDLKFQLKVSLNLKGIRV
ncbi:hypothetical protein H8S20_10765 [Clostridium sp. NSJ-6]|uniref:Uncharacterized protein n=1 Tax=Clostridium hominis TaxID=2763036 RepID=A0ABR7DD97_9CLOT|nr:hypothetical protein [Clostridium hominis]MBC5629371.1 hypothetical protein [Clostridium hominis]MDU2671267.1 hypothetical protein [Clostridium sp.]